MPRVPTYDSLQVQANALPQARLNSTPVQDHAGQQSQQMARGFMQAGDAAGRVALDMQQQANEVRISEGANALKEEELRLTFNEEVGYQGLRGKDAIERPDGKALWDEYGEKLQQRAAAIEDSLGNDAQKMAFRQVSQKMLTDLRGRAMQHVLSEDRTYRASVWEGVQKTAVNEILLAYGDPEAVNAATRRIEAAVYQDAQLRGMSAEWQEAKKRDLLSSAHKSVAASLLDEGKVDTARSYVSQYKELMSGEDLLVIHKSMQTQVEAGIVHESASAASTLYGQTFDPSDLGQLTFAIKQVESAGQRHGKDGQLLTSPKGALGEMQVKPETAKNPGFGIKPAKDNSPEELARVGREYIPAMIKHYGGDVEKAIAAYNAGPGNVDAAVKRAGKEGGHWMTYLPKETQEYLPKVHAVFSQGRTRMAATKQDYVEAAQRRAISLGANAGTLTKVAKAAEEQYERDKQAVEQRADDALYNVMDALSQNGGNYDGLPVSLKQALPADKLDNALKFAETLRKAAQERKTDQPDVYLLLSNPETLAQLSDVEFLKLLPDLKDSTWQSFADKRSKLRNGGDTEISTWAQQKSQFADALGLKGEGAGKFMISVDQQLEDEKIAKGRPLSWGERQSVLDRSVLSVSTPRWWGTGSMPMYQARTEGRDRDAAPQWTEDQLRKASQALVGAGFSNPTPSQVEALLRKTYGFSLPSAQPASTAQVAAPVINSSEPQAPVVAKSSASPPDTSLDFARHVAFSVSKEGRQQREEEFKRRKDADAAKAKAEKEAEEKRARDKSRIADTSKLEAARQAYQKNNAKD